MEINRDDNDWGLEGLGLEEPAKFTPTPEPDLFSDLGDHEVYIPLSPLLEDNFPEVIHKEPLSPWPTRFPIELALGAEDEDSVLLRHSISPLQFEIFKSMPAFRRDMAEAQKTIREQGLTFVNKCKMIAEEYLEEVYLMLSDTHISPKQRFEMWQHVVKLGNLEPKEEKVSQNQNQQMVNIQINL